MHRHPAKRHIFQLAMIERYPEVIAARAAGLAGVFSLSGHIVHKRKQAKEQQSLLYQYLLKVKLIRLCHILNNFQFGAQHSRICGQRSRNGKNILAGLGLKINDFEVCKFTHHG